MNPIREAAIALDQAEAAHPGLHLWLEIDPKYVLLAAERRGRRMSRVAVWAEIEDGKVNILLSHLSLIVERMMGEDINDK